MAWITDQVSARRQTDQILIAVMDGQEALWETVQLHLKFDARTIPVLDIIHVLRYVWEAAGLFETTDGVRRAFARGRILRILHGEVRAVIRGLRRLGSTRRLTGASATRSPRG